MSWKEAKTVTYWLQGLKGRTKINYQTYFPRFLKFVQMNPDQIIEERMKDLTSTDPKTRFKWEQRILEYQDKLKEEGLKGYALHDYIKAVMSFFSRNRVPLSFRKGDIPSPTVSRHEWIPTNAQVRMIYQVCNIRDKVGLLLAYHCGLSPVDIEGLSIENLPIYDSDGKINVNEHQYFELYRSKTEIITQTCLSNELLHDIDIYLRSRGYPKKGALLVSHKGERLTGKDLNTSIKDSSTIALGEELGKQFKITKLRKSYQDGLDNTPTISKNYAELMMGHSIGISGHYSKPSALEIKTAYDQLFARISINGYVQARGDMKQIQSSLDSQQKIVDLLARGLARILAEQQKIEGLSLMTMEETMKFLETAITMKEATEPVKRKKEEKSKKQTKEVQ